jgi:methionyl-tRNA formyltransferase
LQPIKDDIQYPALAKELATEGARCVLQALSDLPNLSKNATVQDESQVTKAPKVHKGN